MMQKVGAGLTAMDAIPTFPMGMISRTDSTKGQIASTYTWKAGAITVNKNGERFCNETEDVVSIREVALEKQPEAVLFDIYTGTGIAEGKKSVAFNLTFRADDRSLTAQEADDEVKAILTLLESELGAVLR